MHVGNWNACPLALSMWHSVLSIDILRHYCFRCILPYRPVTTFLLFLDADFLQCFLPLLLLLVLRNLQNTVTSVLSYVPLIPSLDPISPVLIYSSHVIARKLRVTSTNTALRKLQSCWWYTAWNKSCLSVKRTNYNNNFSGPPKTVSKPFSPSLSKFDIDVEINFLRWLQCRRFLMKFTSCTQCSPFVLMNGVVKIRISGTGVTRWVFYASRHASFLERFWAWSLRTLSCSCHSTILYRVRQ